jgi:transcriptional regulator with XRE-family HTH domain
MSTESGDGVGIGVARILGEIRRKHGWSMEELAGRAGVDRTYVGLLERGERQVTIAIAARLAVALGVRLSEILSKIEQAGSEEGGADRLALVAPLDIEVLPRPAPRSLDAEDFLSDTELAYTTGFNRSSVAAAVDHTYQTLDLIDEELVARGAAPLAELVELNNLSSMLGNLLGSGLAQASSGRYKRNGPHKYPDLLAQAPELPDLELKVAMETNRPKGHLPKAGPHLTFRYVLCDRSASFTRGRANRGVVASIWEIRFGVLGPADYDLSNTEGDSGKTATIKLDRFRAMELIYRNSRLNPYAR